MPNVDHDRCRHLDFAFAVDRIEAGDGVRFLHDFYGGQWVELRHRFVPWWRRRVRLAPEELLVVKSLVRANCVRAQNAGGGSGGDGNRRRGWARTAGLVSRLKATRVANGADAG